MAQPWLTRRRCQPRMTIWATSPSPKPHLDRVPPVAGPAGGGNCCTGGGSLSHGRAPAALPPPASGSRAGRPRRRGPAPPPSPSRPPTPSRPRRRGGGSGPGSSGRPRGREGAAMPDGDLWQLAEVEEISIGFTRPDGPTGSTPVWAVQAGEAVFVRSIRGRRGGWYRRLGVNPDGEVGDGAHTHPCAPARSRTPAPWRRSPVPTRPSTVTARMEAAADRGGGRRDAVAGARPSRRWPPGDAHLIPGRTRPAEAVQTQGAGRRSITLTQRLRPEPGRAGSG